MKLANKHAIVVGGGGHIGSGIVETLTGKECQVTIVGRHQEPLSLVRNKYGGKVKFVVADFTIEDEVKSCFKLAKEREENIDFIVYSAGLEPDPDVPLVSYPTEAWHQTINTYLTGFFLCFRESMRVIEPGGHILVISSAVTRMPPDKLPDRIFVGHYAAAKAGLNEFCKWARREAHERQVLLSCLAPGAVDVPFHQNAPPHRKPPAMLPIQAVAMRIVEALERSEEIDEMMVANPKG